MVLTGVKGSLKLGANKVAKIESWKLGIKAGEIDVTTWDSAGWEEFETGLLGWEVSFEGILDKDDTTGQQAIFNAMATRANLAIDLFVSDGVTADYDGNIRVTGVDVDTTMKDKIKLSIKAKGNGKLNGFEVVA